MANVTEAVASAFPECIAAKPSGNVGLAFGLVTAAGLSTTIGAALAFVVRYFGSARDLFLAACLALAAGVMVYVSFVEIFAVKAIEEFSKCSEEKFAHLYATLCFFGGIGLTYLFDMGLRFAQQRLSQCAAAQGKGGDAAAAGAPGDVEAGNDDNKAEATDSTDGSESKQAGDISADPAAAAAAAAAAERDDHIGHDGGMVAAVYENHAHDSAALIRMGIFAGVALAFHNFPEGLATFVSVLEDPSVGASLAIAIAIHNIPEGVCVAMPIYYATGSRGKAFFWATLSGLTELVGALLGWVVLKDVVTPVVYALLFGIVAGMMVYISVKELVPTAHRYDPHDRVTSVCFVAGMAVMALSLVLFKF